MLMIKDLNLDQKLSVGVALAFSFDVLPLFETEFSDDLRPRKAIESAIICLQNPSKEARAAAAAAAAAAAVDAARDAAANADNAANAVYAAHAAYAARYAAYVAAHAAYAAANAGAYAASVFARSAANAAGYAARAAASATNVADKDKYIHDRIVKLLPLILEYKIENKQWFNDAEKVLESLNDEDKVSFLFNLDVLR